MSRNSYTKHWPRQNLAELVRFLEKQYDDGFSLNDIAEKIRHTPQYVSKTFTKDDVKLSKAEAIARCYGHELRLLFPQKDPMLCYGKQYCRDFPEAGNLQGLVRYLCDSNISINYMSQRIGKANSVITNAFRKGDIMISTLYEIIMNLGIEVHWYFEKIPEKET